MKIQPKSKYKYTIKRPSNPFSIRWNGIPAIKRKTINEPSLYNSVFTSVFWHILSFVLIWIISFVLLYFGIAPKLFPKPKPKVQNIEFNLNNSIWKRPPRKERPALRTQASPAAAPAHAPEVSPSKPKVSTPVKSNSFSKMFNNFTHKNTVKTPAVTNKVTSKSPFTTKAKGGKGTKHSIPSFSVPMSNLKSMSSGLNSGSSHSKHHATGFSNSKSVFGDNDNGSSVSGRGSSNGAGFNKSATRKMISSYDISPYVNELKRNVRWNWKSPKTSGKRVELFLRIARDGRLIILNVKKTSESGDIDNAALSAVRKCVPLNPLPSKYSKNYLDVIFTFDSNYVGSRF